MASKKRAGKKRKSTSTGREVSSPQTPAPEKTDATAVRPSPPPHPPSKNGWFLLLSLSLFGVWLVYLIFAAAQRFLS